MYTHLTWAPRETSATATAMAARPQITAANPPMVQ